MARAAGFLAGLGLAALLHGAVAGADLPVDLELVLAVDISPSMDRGEQELQRAGYVAALEHPEVLHAIRGGMYGRVAVTYVEWGGSASQVTTLPWTLVEDEASARAAAATLAAQPLRTSRGTSISGALTFAARLFEANGFEGFRRVIDVSGDGPNNVGTPVEPARDAALEQGIIINGLPIMLRPASQGAWDIPDLDLYYADCVIGGPGSFVLPVYDPTHLAEAIRRKLVLEIAGAPARVMPAAATRAAGSSDCMIGERLRRRWSVP